MKRVGQDVSKNFCFEKLQDTMHNKEFLWKFLTIQGLTNVEDVTPIGPRRNP